MIKKTPLKQLFLWLMVWFLPLRFVYGFVIDNPLVDINTLPDFIAAILRIAVMVITPLLVVCILYAGFLFVSAQGNEAQITKAKMVLLWTVIGGGVALGAQIFASAIQGTINSLR